MLQFIRDRAQGVIAWFIVFLIVIPFALWGINDYMGGGKEKPVAEVNGAAISKGQLQDAYQQQRRRLEQMLGANFKPEMFAEGPMKRSVLDGLIERELVVQATHDAGIQISDAAVAEVIRGEKAFQEGGKFSQAAYERILRRQGLSPASFEAQVRRDLMAQQWRIAIQQSAFVTSMEKESYRRLQQQTRDFGYLLFAADKGAKGIKVSDKEVQRFYDENSARFTEPEKVRVAYLELSSAQLASTVAVTDDDVRSYYESHRDEFNEPESRRASHILFRIEAGASQEVEKGARKQAEDALKRIRNGESFAQLAKKLSQDSGSASKGGDLGFFGRGAMVPPFEEAVFSLKKGEISEPVRTDFGYHIIRLEEVRGGGGKPFKQVRKQIHGKLRAERTQEQFYDLSEKFSNMTYEHPDTLQVAADELKLPIKHSDYFARGGGQGIAADPKFVQAAFSEEVFELGNNSDVVELAPDRFVVLRLEDRRPEAQRQVKDVRGQIVEQLRGEKARAAARAAAEKALATVMGGTDPATMAKGSGGTWKSVKGIGREDSKLPRPVVERAFQLPRPGTTRSADRVTLPDGAEAIVVLLAVHDGTAADKGEFQAEPLIRAEAEASYRGGIAALRKQGDIEINRDQM